MGKLKSLWTKGNTGSEISAADKRLRRYVGIDADRRANEETKWMSLEDATNNPKEEEAVINLAEASRRAAEAINGADSETIN